jgi:hypothetical protein
VTWLLGARPSPRRRCHSPRLALGSGAVIALGSLLASCTSSSSSGTTTVATTTTLPAAQAALLDPKKLVPGDVGSGWTVDTSPNAASTQGAPGCLADLVNVKGSSARTSVVLVGPKSDPAAVIQTVAVLPSGQAAASTASLQSEFESCAHQLSQPSQGHYATVAPLDGPPGAAGFAARMTLTSGGQHGYFDVSYALRGDVATFVGWYSNSTSTSGFERAAAAALQKL